MLQQGLGPDVGALVEWIGESNAAVRDDFMSAGWATESQFQVRVDGVVTRYGGPTAPDLDPEDLPAVASVQIAVEREALS